MQGAIVGVNFFRFGRGLIVVVKYPLPRYLLFDGIIGPFNI